MLGAYTYDAFGRRVRKIAGGVTELFFYGPGAHLVEEQAPAGSPATARTYVYLEAEPAGVVDQATGGTPSFAWLHGDHLTTPRAVTSAPASGGAAVVWRATYAPFGLAETDEDPDGDLHYQYAFNDPVNAFDADGLRAAGGKRAACGALNAGAAVQGDAQEVQGQRIVRGASRQAGRVERLCRGPLRVLALL